MIKNLPSLYSDSAELNLDITILGRVATEPVQTAESIAEYLYNECVKRKPFAKLEDSRYIESPLAVQKEVGSGGKIDLFAGLVDIFKFDIDASASKPRSELDNFSMPDDLQSLFAFDSSASEEERTTKLQAYSDSLHEDDAQSTPNISQVEHTFGSVKHEDLRLTQSQQEELGYSNPLEPKPLEVVEAIPLDNEDEDEDWLEEDEDEEVVEEVVEQASPPIQATTPTISNDDEDEEDWVDDDEEEEWVEDDEDEDTVVPIQAPPTHRTTPPMHQTTPPVRQQTTSPPKQQEAKDEFDMTGMFAQPTSARAEPRVSPTPVLRAEPRVSPTPVPQPVQEEEPKDLRQFLRKHPNSELEYVLQYFSKREVDHAIKMGKVVLRKNKLKVM